MTERGFDSEQDGGLTRRQVLHGALAGGAMLSAGGLLAACGGSSGSSSAASSAKSSPASTGALKSGGSLRVGATGGGAKDTIDAHLPTRYDLAQRHRIFGSRLAEPRALQLVQ